MKRGAILSGQGRSALRGCAVAMAAAGASGLYVNPNTGAAQAGLMPFRNALINGDMRINQRGTSTNLASLTAVATASPWSWVTDRWNVYRASVAAGGVIGQGTNLTTSDPPFSDAGIKTFGRIGRLSGNTATNSINLAYNMESQDCYRFVGKTVTMSFYYRTGANFSGSALSSSIVTGTGPDQALIGAITGYTVAGAANNTLNTLWQKKTLTCTLGTNINQIFLSFSYGPTGTAGAADYYDITGVQLELGSVATPFEVRPYPVELQLCQRYYYRRISESIYDRIGIWSADSTTGGYSIIQLPVVMRAVHSSVGVSAIADFLFSNGTVSLIDFDSNDRSSISGIVRINGTGFTTNAMRQIIANNKIGGYFEFSSEL